MRILILVLLLLLGGLQYRLWVGEGSLAEVTALRREIQAQDRLAFWDIMARIERSLDEAMIEARICAGAYKGGGTGKVVGMGKRIAAEVPAVAAVTVTTPVDGSTAPGAGSGS